MNILILSWRSPGHPNAGGAEQVTLEHAKGWVRVGHDVVWFSSNFPNAKIQETIDGVVVIRRGDYVVGVRLHAILWYFFGSHPKFDLVIDEFHGIPFFTPLFVKGRKLAFIHEVAKEVWKLNPWPKPFNLLPSVLGPLVEPYIFKHIYKKIPFLTVSNSTKDDLEKFGISKNKISIINNGVKLQSAGRNIEKPIKKTAIYLGAISEDKGIFDAVKVFGQIERKDDMWQYLIVGKGTGEYVKKIKKLALSEGISDKLDILGYVSDKRKFELLAKAHVLVNTSYHEGWGLVNIEANSAGTPVAAYNVHGIKDSVVNGKTGILVDKGEYRTLAQELLKLVGNEKEYKKFQDNAVKWSKKFTWEKATKQSLELIESL